MYIKSFFTSECLLSRVFFYLLVMYNNQFNTEVNYKIYLISVDFMFYFSIQLRLLTYHYLGVLNMAKRTNTTRHFYDKPGPFLGMVRQMLIDDDRHYVILAGDLKVPAIWLKKIMEGEITNPGLNRMEYVFEQLTGKTLPVG